MTSLPAPLRWLYSLEWRRGFFDWARSDGVTWVYIFKVLIAAFLTLWLAMRLELPQPRTAMITVFIVMQPQSGQVFAKSFYRFLGTLAGSTVMVQAPFRRIVRQSATAFSRSSSRMRAQTLAWIQPNGISSRPPAP